MTNTSTNGGADVGSFAPDQCGSSSWACCFSPLALYALFNLFAATIASVFFIGVLMIIGGVARVVHAFQVDKTSSLVFWLLSGALYAVAGAMVLANPLLGAAIFTLLLAASLIASGVVMIVVSFSSRVQQGRWWISCRACSPPSRGSYSRPAGRSAASGRSA